MSTIEERAHVLALIERDRDEGFYAQMYVRDVAWLEMSLRYVAGLLHTEYERARQVEQAVPMLLEIQAEVTRARHLYPGNANRLAALMGEAGEAANALLKREGRDRVRAECVQVAAMAIRLAEEGDAGFEEVAK